jgi:hypothetical protein
MARTFEEIQASLPVDERAIVGNAAAIATVTTEIETLKPLKGKYGEARSEIDRLLKRFKPLEDSLTEIGLDPTDPETPQKIKEFKEASGKAGQASELEKMVKKLTTQIDALTTENTATKERIRLKTLSQSLNESLAPLLVTGVSSYVVKGLISDGTVKLADDGESVVFMIDGEEKSLKDGINAWSKEHKDLIKNTQVPGGSSAAGGPSSGKKNADGGIEMKKSEWNKLDPKERARFVLNLKNKLIND